ncbi:Putative glucosamine-1-phosphate N-acetyltransferase [Criblamydia sequanensis CRIB-18]|uniref:Glucosamine-1-phosphate N-acetyltransferase n=1 Tax=Candidatus Criblamydia sequanensis CRIB-18 TaxID=1437425 RepID=A0A090D2K4_9BACT|nr:Putative glucosamine-1-phosphate N-acetyltransferase [Criblamydia sequanensis CRIB-18]
MWKNCKQLLLLTVEKKKISLENTGKIVVHKGRFVNFFRPQQLFQKKDSFLTSFFDRFEWPWELLPEIHSFLLTLPLGDIKSKIPDGVYLENRESISIEEDCIIESGAFIRGPCFIGRGSEIRHGAYIRGDVIAGEKVVIGHTTEVKNAIFCSHAKAAHFAYIGDSILGENVNLGAGTKCANLKFDHSAVSVRTQDQTFETGLKKMGAFFGADAQTGCNTVTNPGTIFLRNAKSYPNSTVCGVVPENHIFIKRNEFKPV